MNDLDTLKSRLSCRDVAQRLGVDVPRRGDAECPKHHGHSLRLKDDWFYCHGGCAEQGGKGDVINLYQFITGADFKDAVDELARWAGVTIRWSADEAEKVQQRRRIEDVLAWAADFYASRYAGSPAETYAQTRGIHHDEARLGYAPDSWVALKKAADAAGLDITALHEAGLLGRRDDGTFYDVLRHRLVIPAYERGRCVYLQGRALESGTTDNGTPKYRNIALGEPPLYHVNGALKAGTTPVVTESTSDVLRLTAAGLPAIGTYGATLKDGQRVKLRRFQHLYAAIHNDDAGALFADVLASELGERLVVVPPPAAFKDWDAALASGAAWAPDETLTWLRWKIRSIPTAMDSLEQQRRLAPVTAYLAGLEDAARVAVYLEEIRKHFGWSQAVARGYERAVKEQRAERQRASREAATLKADDTGQAVNLLPDVVFINPAQAYHDGVVYVSRMVTRRETVQGKFGVRQVEVHRPVVITSDRRILPLPILRKDDPPGTLLYLDTEKRLALHGMVHQAATKWSYAGMTAHINGEAPLVQPHAVYDEVVQTFRRYLYHPNENDYVVDVLWCIGTYFHQLFDAYPYLNIHGQKGSGKTTILVLLEHLAFNGYHVTNVSEASLFRWIEAAAPTMLIDEQEGLTSRQAAKEQKADLMGILKSGYQKGPVVTRQDTNDPTIMRQYHIYCPKAIASVELLEDILGDRSLLTYMHRAPDTMYQDGSLVSRNRIQPHDFEPIRDRLYLLLMQHAAAVAGIAPQVRMTYAGRFGELALPLFTIAALVDHSRGAGPQVVTQLSAALETQAQRRIERNDATPEQMLRAAVELAATDAMPCDDRPRPESQPQRLNDGRVVMDALHIADAFRRLFPTARESYFRLEWLGKQVSKADYIEPYQPDVRKGSSTLYRWRRRVEEKSERTGDLEWTEKFLTVYLCKV